MEKPQINYEDPEYNYDQPTIPKLLKKKSLSPNYKKNKEIYYLNREETNNFDVDTFEGSSRRDKFYSILGKIKKKKISQIKRFDANENQNKCEEDNENIFLNEKYKENLKNEGFIKRTRKLEGFFFFMLI